MKTNDSAALRSGVVVLGAIALAVVYGNVSTFGFMQWDDRLHIQENTGVHALTAANLWWMLTTPDIDYWRPLSLFSHALDFALFGDDAGWHHVTSVVLHAINAVLVALLASSILARHFTTWQALRRQLTAGGAGLVFLVHPQHVETVAWLSERDGVLCATFYLAAVLAYARDGARTARGLVIVLALFFLAVLSKPLALSLPLVLLSMDVYPLRRLGHGQSVFVIFKLVIEKWLFWLLMLLVVGVTYLGVVAVGGAASLEDVPFSERLVNAARSFWLYPYRFVVPLGLSPFYPMEVLDNSLSAQNLLAPVALLALIVAGLAGVWLRRGAVLGLTGIYLAMVGPTLGLVHLGALSSADRYAYLPGALFSVASAIGASALLGVMPSVLVRRVTIGAGVLVLVALAVLSHRQVQVWRDDFTMWRTVLTYHPTWRPHRNISDGMQAYSEGRYQDAIRLLTIAQAQGKRLGDVHLYVALSYQGLGDSDTALYHAARGLELGERQPAYLFLAVRLHIDGKRFAEARALIEELKAKVPDNPDMRRLAASVELEAGAYPAAARLLDETLERFEATPATLVLRGIVDHRRGRLDAAQRFYERALELQPGLLDAENNLRTIRKQKTLDQ